ncbi:MAG: lipoyl synthase [Acidobacteria bacterium]|nr:lipoyl synthase [Acidobacteriota bacterium]
MVDLPVLSKGVPGCAGPAPGDGRKPDWLRVRAPGGDNYTMIKRTLRERGLFTVCEEAQCPNVGECWGGGTATFMLLGEMCTRGCRFCAVTTGNPGGWVDRDEPRKLAESVALMGLKYIVLTMVDRDDLPDGGAEHVSECIEHLKTTEPELIVEALVGDFAGNRSAIDAVVESGMDVFAHNIETVSRLERSVRDARCGYEQTLDVLRHAKAHQLAPYTKSSIMLGLGESHEEVLQTMQDLRAADVDFLTLGQYLQPSHRHLDVQEWVHPERFDALREAGEEMGFRYVAAGPLVRSSYRAGEFFIESLVRKRRAEVAPSSEEAAWGANC